ncbi:MAG: hypothetical protein NTZ79_08265 [Proteobacteria bacterium]|nr:hypothetical protein [Pseudomonadota bacterium]
MDSQVDDLAERLTALGGVAEGTVQVAFHCDSLKPYSLAIRDGRRQLEALAVVLAVFGELTRPAIGAASAAGDEKNDDLCD